MMLRQTIIAAAGFLAACSSNPVQSPAVARRLVTAALVPCDSAVHVLTGNLAHARPAGAYQMAREVEAQCSGSTLDIMKASAPASIAQPCQDASEAARLLASAVQAEVSASNGENEARLADALSMTEGQRQQCEAAITA